MRPTTSLDICSSNIYADEQAITENLKSVRHDQPVVWVEREPFAPFWAVLRHDDIMEIERNPDLWLNEPRLTLVPTDIEQRTIEQFGSRTSVVRTLLDMDGREHRKYRNVTQEWFNSRFLRQLELRMASLAVEYVDKFEAIDGECDFIDEVAVPYPLIMITSILGLPDSDAPLVLKLTQELFGAQDPERQRSGDYGLEAAQEFFMYLSGVLAERRKEPEDDLMSVLATSTIDGEPMPDLDALSYGMLLAAAGHDTTSSSLGIGMLQFARNPMELEKFKSDPKGLISTAAQEIFRMATPVRHFLRTAAENTEVRGQKIAKGENVCLLYLSANRDEDAFDDPYCFRIDRFPNRHLAFGYGPHHCLGRNLAEMEIAAFFAELGRRVESIELAGDPVWLHTNHTGGLKHLPIRCRMR